MLSGSRPLVIELGSDGWRDCGGTTATGMLLLPVFKHQGSSFAELQYRSSDSEVHSSKASRDGESSLRRVLDPSSDKLCLELKCHFCKWGFLAGLSVQRSLKLRSTVLNPTFFRELK